MVSGVAIAALGVVAILATLGGAMATEEGELGRSTGDPSMTAAAKRYTIHVVDVFTERPLAGNQLAVVLGADEISGEVMQRLAREMNFSETTFVLPPADPSHAAHVRIFTPGSELPFAGHPTIGTAWVLYTEGLVASGKLEFALEEGIGPVAVRGEQSGGGLRFWMTHPEVSFGAITSDRTAAATALGLDRERAVG